MSATKTKVTEGVGYLYDIDGAHYLRTTKGTDSIEVLFPGEMLPGGTGHHWGGRRGRFKITVEFTPEGEP